MQINKEARKISALSTSKIYEYFGFEEILPSELVAFRRLLRLSETREKRLERYCQPRKKLIMVFL